MMCNMVFVMTITIFMLHTIMICSNYSKPYLYYCVRQSFSTKNKIKKTPSKNKQLLVVMKAVCGVIKYSSQNNFFEV